jgi:hypothetical protein
MYVVTEKDYLQFLDEISDDMTFEEIYDKFDAINYETNFSGRSYRLYDVVYELDQFKDKFTEDFDCNGYVTTVEELKKIVEASDKEDLVEKMGTIHRTIRKRVFTVTNSCRSMVRKGEE